ncbi:MAG: SDR family oxidoreductase [Acidobacteriota bacterium]
MATEFDVVTGGAGFIGSHLCRALLRQGRKVRILDNFSTGTRENLEQIKKEHPDQCEVYEQDIRELSELKKLFQNAGTIYHQAAITSVQKSVEDPLGCNSVNVEGTLKVLVAAKDAGVQKVVFASSSAVYGDSERLPKREEMKPEPISPYAVTKYVGELYCKIFSDIHRLPTLALRYFNVFGPKQDPKSEYATVVPRFISRTLAGERPIIYGDGEQSRDFIFVQDVVAANLLAAASDVQGTHLNVACGQAFTVNEVARIINEILDLDLEPIYESARLGDVRRSEADISQASKLIDFKPKCSLRNGLSQTVEWFQNKGEGSGGGSNGGSNGGSQ